VFGEELARLELELPSPTQFDTTTMLPIPQMKVSGNTSEDQKTKIDSKVLADQYSRQFVAASIFTLKRVISDEALRVLSSKSSYPEKLALWYSKWVVELTQRNVDF